MAFTEFYCDASAGSNVNAGDNTANGVVQSTNGAWSTVTNIFTATSGTPFSGVSVGDFCALMADGGSVAAYVARVTAVGGGGLTLTLSTTAKSGTAPTTSATAITATTGGAWKGPNGTDGFPVGFITNALTDSSINRPRVNFKNNATYNITAALAQANAGPIRFQGYSSSPGDGGKATIDGGTSGTSYVLFTINNVASIWCYDLIFQNNGATGSASGVVSGVSGSGIFARFQRCVVNNVRGSGFSATSSAQATYVECEAYACNQSNTASGGGFAGLLVAERCVSHDNVGSNAHGFVCNIQGFSTATECIADTNGGSGILLAVNSSLITINSCELYNNSGSGFAAGNAGGNCYVSIENCNFVKNGAYGINLVDGSTIVASITNCGFGSGTMVNTSGQTNITTGTDSVEVAGSKTYASGVTPWVDPDNGDFRINLSDAKGAGRGAYTQTASGYAGTIAYPDIGAAQHQDSGGATTPINQIVKVASIGTY